MALTVWAQSNRQPAIPRDAALEAKIEKTLSRMTLDEKIGQMLELNLDETKDFMSRAGYALSPSSLFDVIVQYFIELEEFDIYKINLALFDHGQPCLGA